MLLSLDRGQDPFRVFTEFGQLFGNHHQLLLLVRLLCLRILALNGLLLSQGLLLGSESTVHDEVDYLSLSVLVLRSVRLRDGSLRTSDVRKLEQLLIVEDPECLAVHYEQGGRDLLLVVGSVLGVVNLRLLSSLVQKRSPRGSLVLEALV